MDWKSSLEIINKISLVTIHIVRVKLEKNSKLKEKIQFSQKNIMFVKDKKVFKTEEIGIFFSHKFYYFFPRLEMNKLI